MNEYLKCFGQLVVIYSLFTSFCHSVLLIAFSCMHADLQPYILFADGGNGTIYHSNLNGSGIQQLVTGLPRPLALDFDYRYSAF